MGFTRFFAFYNRFSADDMKCKKYITGFYEGEYGSYVWDLMRDWTIYKCVLHGSVHLRIAGRCAGAAIALWLRCNRKKLRIYTQCH